MFLTECKKMLRISVVQYSGEWGASDFFSILRGIILSMSWNLKASRVVLLAFPETLLGDCAIFTMFPNCYVLFTNTTYMLDHIFKHIQLLHNSTTHTNNFKIGALKLIRFNTYFWYDISESHHQNFKIWMSF